MHFKYNRLAMELTLEDIKEKNIPVIERKFITVGGGIGSFCWVDALRIHGVKKSDIAVLGRDPIPYMQLKTYCDNIGLTHDERLRSDSGSRPDNFWGFPGYALSEAFDAIKNSKLINASKIFWQIFSEGILADYYSPKAGRVYDSVAKEADRICWEEMVRQGEALSLRKLDDGRFAVLYIKAGGKSLKALVGNVVFLAIGHTKKQASSKYYSAYEPNKSLYKKIEKMGGRVAVIGRGSTAAKVIERLIDLNLKGSTIEILSVFRDMEKQKDVRNMTQRNLNGWRLQYFNWPRAAFGGRLAREMQKQDTRFKKELLRVWSSPTAIPKKAWLKKVHNALKSGYYKIIIGKTSVALDYVIDAGGFDDRVIADDFFNDLVKTYKVPLSVSGGIRTDESFRIDGMYSPNGAVFVSGVGASGNYYGPVDSFFGMQYISLKSIDLLASMSWLRIKKLNILRSFNAWLKWVGNKKV